MSNNTLKYTRAEKLKIAKEHINDGLSYDELSKKYGLTKSTIKFQVRLYLAHGEKAHSLYFGKDAFKLLKGDNKELLIVPNADHCDLYDGGINHDKIPFDKIEEFIRKNI